MGDLEGHPRCDGHIQLIGGALEAVSWNSPVLASLWVLKTEKSTRILEENGD